MDADTLQAHFANGTFLQVLMNEVKITQRPGARSTLESPMTEMQFEFPEWFSELLTEDTQARIIQQIRTIVPQMVKRLQKEDSS